MFGSYTVDSLVRTGIGNIVLIDKAIIDISNVNTNLMADTKVVGKYKVDIAKKRLLNINPNLNIKIIKEYVSKDNVQKILTDDVDYIVDTVDTISDKVELISEAYNKKIPVISSMGTGDKFDPTQFEIADISKITDNSYVSVLKSELKARKINRLKVIYSKEKPARFRSKDDYSNISKTNFVPSVAGIIIASEVVKDLVKA